MYNILYGKYIIHYLKYLKSQYLRKFTKKKILIEFLFSFLSLFYKFPLEDERNDWKYNKSLFNDFFIFQKIFYSLLFSIPVSLFKLHVFGFLYWISLKEENRK